MKRIVVFVSILLLAISVCCQDHWKILNEEYVHSFNYVDFINKDTGWIADNSGLFKTIDGAENWELVYDDTILHEINFCNDNIGWAYVKSEFQSPDPEACIVKTLDGGLTWFPQRNLSLLEDLCVVSDSVVYALWAKHIEDWTGYIIRTVDGGNSWEEIVISKGFFPRESYFHNSDTGIVSNHENIIFRTFDGGKTWNSVSTGFERIGNIGLLNGRTGYFTASNDDSNFICKTNDTFDSWEVIATDSSYFGHCHFFDHENIFGIVSDRMVFTRNIIVSEDGGSSWNKADHMQLISSVWGYRIETYVVENVAYLFAWSGNMSFILKSTDLGTHWKCLNLSFPMEDVHFISQEKGFIAGSFSGFHHHGGFLLRTEDGGNTWNPVYNPGFAPGEIHFVSDSIGFICDSGGGDVFYTRDGGETWYPDSSLCILDMHSLSDTESWLMACDYYSGYGKISILRTKDGGFSWDSIMEIDDQRFSSIHMLDGETGYMVGEVGNILKFSGNADRRSIQSGTMLPLNKVYFVDERYGLIAGGYYFEEEFQSILLLTEDGGNQWVKGPDLPFLIFDFYFSDSLQGYAVGTDKNGRGILLETTDRGRNWSEIELEKSLSAPLRALHFRESFGWAVGDNSLILRYSNQTTSGQDNLRTNIENYFVNYPNPFNTTTTISYELSASSPVEINIYDMHGRKVTTVVNEYQISGTYKISLRVDSIGPGIYVCELKTRQGNKIINLIKTE